MTPMGVYTSRVPRCAGDAALVGSTTNVYIYINTDGEGERGSDRERSLQSNGCNWHAESYLSEYTHRTWEWHKNLIHAAGHPIQAWG